MRVGRIKLLQVLLAFSLVFNIFADFTLTIHAAINSKTEIVDTNSASESIISEMEFVNGITLGENDSTTDSELSEESVTSNTDEAEIPTDSGNQGQVNGDQELENENFDSSMTKEEDKNSTLSDSIEQSTVTDEDSQMSDQLGEASDEDEGIISLQSEEVGPRAVGTGLVQLYQVVPDGQQSKEGKTTSEIMSALQCQPNHDLLPLSNTSSAQTTYVNSCYVDDALYLGEDSDYFYIYVSGYEGKVAKSKSHYFDLDLNNDGTKVSYEIRTVAYFIPDASTYSRSNDTEQYTEVLDVPYLNYNTDYLDKYSEASPMLARSTATVQSPSYYANESGSLIHYITNNVTKSNNYSKIIVGKAPDWMKSNVKYYSYDGVYFFNRWQDIQVDGSGAVNASNPFYNYYQYLPFRSKSLYTASEIDNYTKSYGYTSIPLAMPVASNESKLVGTGQYFYNVQDAYGINGALQYAMGIHESGWGRSSISVTKNNLFGMNATDANPYGNATTFPSVQNGIYYHADRYLSWGYTDPIDDYRFFGSHVGNKGSGMNVKYASDPFWGEKIAGWYYRFDSESGLKDYNYYSIGIKQSNSAIDIKSQASSSSKTYYQTMNKKSNLKFGNYPVLITGEENGYYRIQTDTPIINGSPLFSATYDWSESYGYIAKSAITSINHNNYTNPVAGDYTGNVKSLSWENGVLNISGYGYIQGLGTSGSSKVTHRLVIENWDNSSKKYYYNLDTNKDSSLGSFSYGGYKGSIDLTDLPSGTYRIYHEITIDGTTKMVELSSTTTFNVSQSIKGYDHVIKTYNNSNINLSKQIDTDIIYNGRLDSFKFANGKLTVTGYGDIEGYEMPSASSVTHQIIIQNADDLSKKYTYKLNPTYNSWLANDPHNLGGNYAYGWYEGTIDLSSLPAGNYRLYHQMTVDGYTRTEELKWYNDLISTANYVNYSYTFEKYNGSSLKLSKKIDRYEYVGRLDSATWNGEKLKVTGYGELGGLPMASASVVKHEIIFENSTDSSKKYKYTLNPTYNNWLANDPHNLGGNYAYGWYEGTIDLSSLPNGTYKIYHQMTVNGYTQREELKFYNDLASKIVNLKEYSFSKYNGSSLMLTKQASTTREYVGRLDSATWNGEKLKITGYGELGGLSMTSASSVKHELVIENWSSPWKQYVYTLTPIYNSWLAKDPHNLGGNYAYGWYEGTIDLSNLPWGTYRIYHQMTVNGYTQREELKFYDNIPTKTVGGYSYEFLKYNSNSVKLSKQVK